MPLSLNQSGRIGLSCGEHIQSQIDSNTCHYKNATVCQTRTANSDMIA